MICLGQNFRFGFYDVPPRERLRAIRAAGFDAVMFWWGNEFDATDGDKHERMRAALGLGLKVNTLHFPSTHADYLWREELCEGYADLIIEALEDCARYGAGNLVLHTTRALITPPYNDAGLNALGRAVAAAERLGVNIAAENTRFPAYNGYIYKNIPSDASRSVTTRGTSTVTRRRRTSSICSATGSPPRTSTTMTAAATSII